MVTIIIIIIITLPFTIIIDMQNPQWNHYHQFQKIRKIGVYFRGLLKNNKIF